MIGPLSAQSAAPIPREHEPKDTVGTAADFGALMQGGRPERPLVERVFPDHGPAIDSVADMIPGGALTDPGESAPDQLELQANAHVFNEQGFFGSHGLTPGAGNDADRPSAGIRPSVPVTPDAEASDAVGELTSGPPATAMPGAAFHAPASGSSRLGGLRVPRNEASAVVAIPSSVPRASEMPEEVEQPSLQRRTTRGALPGSNPLRVALHELEQGLRVSVRVEALDQTERDRLEHEIAALLVRHGMSPRSIQIHAPMEREFPDRSSR